MRVAEEADAQKLVGVVAHWRLHHTDKGLGVLELTAANKVLAHNTRTADELDVRHGQDAERLCEELVARRRYGVGRGPEAMTLENRARRLAGKAGDARRDRP